jgi:hypothetical protein
VTEADSKGSPGTPDRDIRSDLDRAVLDDHSFEFEGCSTTTLSSETVPLEATPLRYVGLAALTAGEPRDPRPFQPEWRASG